MAASAAASLRFGVQRDSLAAGGALTGSGGHTQILQPISDQAGVSSDPAPSGAAAYRLTRTSDAAEPFLAEGATEAQPMRHPADEEGKAASQVGAPRRRVSFANKLPAVARALPRRLSGGGSGEADDGARATAEWVATQVGDL